MSRKLLHTAYILLAALAAAGYLHAQEKKEDEKVRLISARSAQLIEENGQSYRKVIGPARFLHNGTYLLCDTALWNVNTNIIDAMGNVRIIQERTQLSSETLQYVVDENMARFRGSLVQLQDKDSNVLRTRYLDYNTKDSVAVFQNGGAMRDKDGQIMESLYGTYDSKANLFVFNDQVNMYLDTTFVKTSRLEYRSDLSTAYFGFATDMWQDDKMLSANDGWYDRRRELFFFRRNVHLLTKDQESWSDSLYYYRTRNDVDMLGHVELMDTTRNVFALAGKFQYTDTLSQVRMTREPAIMSVTEEKGKRDTLYMGGDVLLLRGIRKCDIPEAWIKDAEKRLGDIAGDPVMEYRKKAAEAAAKAAEEAAKNDPNRPPQPPVQGKKAGKAGDKPVAPPTEKAVRPQQEPQVRPEPDSLVKPQADSLIKQLADSLALAAPADTTVAPTAAVDTTAALVPPADTTAAPLPPADTLAVPAQLDSLAQPKDTTKVNFIWGSRHVRMFRRDMQMAADSLMYTDLDSLVRLYQNPIFYNEGNRQYAADSIYMVIKNQQMEKAHLLSNAFITIQEDPHSYDQIRGTEMVAYFDSTSALTRFDALGGASTLFYLEEQGALATVNKVDSKMIYATFKDGDLERIYYYDNPKNDGYPTVQMPEEDKTLKGFRWDPERRPTSPLDVTSLTPRRSERTAYLARPHTQFKQTEEYFPGQVKKIYRDIAIRDSLQVVRERARQRERDSLARVQADSTLTLPPPDSLTVLPDSLAAAVKDSVGVLPPVPPADSLAPSAPADSLSAQPAEQVQKTEKELKEEAKAREKAAREAAKAAKQAEREAMWAEQDRLYAEKQAAKAQRKLEKERAKKLKALRKLAKKAEKERARFEKYLEKEKKKAQKLKQQ